MFLIPEIIMLAILSALGYLFFIAFIGKLQFCQPNEWMIVVSNGQVKSMGVGISARVNWFSSCVRFPSKIHKVNFRAQQVTKEMQGIEVSGVILWSINNEGEYPLKAVMYLGKDLTKSDATTAKNNLAEMCSAIVRHNIANSTIEAIFKQRDELRDQITEGITRVIQGWGCKVESVEITDVKVLSSRLFNHMQTECREFERKKAEIIRLKTDQLLKKKRLENQLEKEVKKLKEETEVRIKKNKQTIKVSIQNFKMAIKQMETDLSKNKKSHVMKTKMLKNENELAKRQQEENSKLELLKLKLQKKEEDQRRNKILDQKKKEALIKTKNREITKLQRDLDNENILKESETLDNMSDKNFRVKKLDMMKTITSNNQFSAIRQTAFGDLKEDAGVTLIRRFDKDIDSLIESINA